MMYLLKKGSTFVTQLLIMVRRKEEKNDYWKTLFLFLKNFLLFSSICYPFFIEITCKSSLPEVFCKKDVLRNFAKFLEKHLWQSLLLNKVADWGSATLLKKRLWYRYFYCDFYKIFKNCFLEHMGTAASVPQ